MDTAPAASMAPTDPPVVQIVGLHEQPGLAPSLRASLVAEWPAYYTSGGGDIDADLRRFIDAAGQLPLALIGLIDGVPVAVAALKSRSVASHDHLGPWAASGWVRPDLRRRGIGGVMLDAVLRAARGLGFGAVYCGTASAASLLQRRGWQRVGPGNTGQGPVEVFVKRLQS